MQERELIYRFFWQFGVGDDMVGRDYVLRAVELIAAGEKNAPSLLKLLSRESGRDSKIIYGAMDRVRSRMRSRNREAYETMVGMGRRSMWEFLNALMEQIA